MENRIICGDVHVEVDKLPDQSIDMCIFSPPYDGLRDYNGYSFDLYKLGQQLYRVLKDGGVCVMVIQDQTIKGRKSLTSFRTIVEWCDKIGFALFECNIYQKQGKDGAWWSKRFRVDHEYIPIFLKGNRPRVFDKSGIKIPCKHAGKSMRGGANRDKNGITQDSSLMKINETKCPGTILDCANGGDKNRVKRQHPATFPDKIPYTFIQVFTKEGDLVLDPMCGSGSSLVTAGSLNRRYLGIDISDVYCEIAKTRVGELHSNMNKAFINEMKRNKFPCPRSKATRLGSLFGGSASK